VGKKILWNESGTRNLIGAPGYLPVVSGSMAPRRRTVDPVGIGPADHLVPGGAPQHR
jgi:hypothetical protein